MARTPLLQRLLKLTSMAQKANKEGGHHTDQHDQYRHGQLQPATMGNE